MFICKEVITKQECKEILNNLTNWHDGITRLDKKHKNNQEQMHEKYSKLVFDRIASHPEMKLRSFIKKMTLPRFNKYDVGGKYSKHVDFFRQGDIRTDWSMTLFLTDQYDGGELCINNTEIKLPAGDMMVYESGQIHEVKPVIKGSRIAAIAWAESEIRDAHERDILTKLAELMLTEKDKGRMVDLSYVYNNLLRKWC